MQNEHLFHDAYYLWYCVVWWVGTSVSDLNSASIFRIEVKGKAVPLQAWSGPGSQITWQLHRMVVTSALCTGPLYPQEMLLVLISVRWWFDPRAIVRSEGSCQWKIPMTPPGIKPATFWFGAQHLRHCATAVPLRTKTPSAFSSATTMQKEAVHFLWNSDTHLPHHVVSQFRWPQFKISSLRKSEISSSLWSWSKNQVI